MKTIMSKRIILLSAIVAFSSVFNLIFASRTEFFIPSTSDSLPISISISTPPDGVEVKAVVQLVHGMCEHKERYYPFIEYLNNHGYVCVIHDHRGHGASVLSSHDLGYFYTAGYKGMIDDVLMVGDILRKQYPDVPFVLFGHSMGSMVVRSFAKQYDDAIDALIVCGSPSYNAGSSLGEKLASRYEKKYGDHYRPEKIQKLSFGSFNRKFKSENSPNAWVCSDRAVVEKYDADTLCNFIFTANGFENLFELMQYTYSEKNWKLSNKNMPILFISGADDPCIGSKNKFNKAVKKMTKIGYSNVNSKLYPNMRHEILNEVEKQKVWEDILLKLEEWTKNK